ncbi:hypothetical protein CC86DRAFT_410031 [Ophiobolus disseminans]|uniref:Uncharacterized protein n=1 Tax=Ophiobolus disseminans TaxID=1469910 RepID=A0A6A6ZNR2_9PLEO|nr:hypothetical protein CC86DRAFT_410031 [Ophiobolus disseminans]
MTNQYTDQSVFNQMFDEVAESRHDMAADHQAEQEPRFSPFGPQSAGRHVGHPQVTRDRQTFTYPGYASAHRDHQQSDVASLLQHPQSVRSMSEGSRLMYFGAEHDGIPANEAITYQNPSHQCDDDFGVNHIGQLILDLGQTSNDQHVALEVPLQDSEHNVPLAPLLQLQQQQHTAPPPMCPSNGLHYTSFAEAVADISPQSWRNPLLDPSIPNTDVQRQVYVLKLLNAINNTANVYDKRNLNFQKRWVSPISGPSFYYSPTDKEFVACDILALAEKLHRDGPSALISFDPVFWHNAIKTRELTFSQRIDKIVELLAFSKARCEKVLAGTSLQAVVAHPMYLLRMTKFNGTQNEKRQQILKAGREAKKLANEDVET